MLHTKFRGNWSTGSGEDFWSFFFLPFNSMEAILVIWPGCHEQTLVLLHIKFGFDWQNGLGEQVWNCRQNDGYTISSPIIGCWSLTSKLTIFQSCKDGATASWVLPVLFQGVNVSCSWTQQGGGRYRDPRVGGTTTRPTRSISLGLRWAKNASWKLRRLYQFSMAYLEMGTLPLVSSVYIINFSAV